MLRHRSCQTLLSLLITSVGGSSTVQGYLLGLPIDAQVQLGPMPDSDGPITLRRQYDEVCISCVDEWHYFAE